VFILPKKDKVGRNRKGRERERERERRRWGREREREERYPLLHIQEMRSEEPHKMLGSYLGSL
jgi:hypothetical protein